MAETQSTAEGHQQHGKQIRTFSDLKPQWQKFQSTLIVPSEKVAKVSSQSNQTFAYNRQYSQVYSHRLAALAPRCWETILKDKTIKSAKGTSGAAGITRVKRVLELREGIQTLVVGTIVRETVNPKEGPVVEGTKCRPSDNLYLEDESGRVVLGVAQEQVFRYCTGIVMGLLGTVIEDGTFNVTQFFPPTQPKLSTISKGSDGAGDMAVDADEGQDNNNNGTTSTDPHVLILSGLACGDATVPSVPREMLLCYLQGQFGADAAKISRIIVVGPSYAANATMDSIKEFDDFMLQIVASGIPVEVVPSQTDPTTSNWPQRPLHSSLMPRSGTSALVTCTPNPYSSKHDQRLMVGTDGKNIKDMCESIVLPTSSHTPTAASGDDGASANGNKEGDTQETREYTKLTETQALQRCLEWSHICPTGPDSVPTVPHAKIDPMILIDVPDIYFAGNGAEFSSNVVTSHGSETLAINIPAFSSTGEAALVNLRKLTAEPIKFDDASM